MHSPNQTKPFAAEAASPYNLRYEADELDDAAAGIRHVYDRGHLDSEGRVMALRLFGEMQERASALRRMAVLKEQPPINEVAS